MTEFQVDLRACAAPAPLSDSRLQLRKLRQSQRNKAILSGTRPHEKKKFVPGPSAVFSFQPDNVCRLSRLSYESMIEQGYDVSVYSYENPQEIGALPTPAEHIDARQIVPEELVFRDADGGWEGFTNLFQFAALYKHGGLWIDNDYVLRTRLAGVGVVAIQGENDATPLPYVIRLPARSAFAAKGIELAGRYRNGLHPRETTYQELRTEWEELHPRKLNPRRFCPIQRTELHQVLQNSDFKLAGVRGLHLWQQEWRRQQIGFGAGFPAGSTYEILWRGLFGFGDDDDVDGPVAANS